MNDLKEKVMGEVRYSASLMRQPQMISVLLCIALLLALTGAFA